MPSKNVRLPIMVSEAEEKAIEDWRYANRLGSRAEAMRQLIARGLRPDGEPGDAAPAPVRQTSRRAPIDIARVRPYPAKEIAALPEDRRKQMNVALPSRLKAQIGWIVEAKAIVGTKKLLQHEVVAEMLQDAVDAELASVGVKPWN